MKLKRRQKGNALIEFALASAILIPCFVGTFQFGYGFYTYNRVQSTIANSARYASLRTYRCKSSSDIEKVKQAIRNVAVYGKPDATGAAPLVKELMVSNVDVIYELDSLNAPLAVTVNAKNVKIDSVFKAFILTNKPAVKFPFVGRYAPEESEI
jgi:Flp pilus assembly protein TadG